MMVVITCCKGFIQSCKASDIDMTRRKICLVALFEVKRNVELGVSKPAFLTELVVETNLGIVQAFCNTC